MEHALQLVVTHSEVTVNIQEELNGLTESIRQSIQQRGQLVDRSNIDQWSSATLIYICNVLDRLEKSGFDSSLLLEASAGQNNFASAVAELESIIAELIVTLNGKPTFDRLVQSINRDCSSQLLRILVSNHEVKTLFKRAGNTVNQLASSSYSF